MLVATAGCPHPPLIVPVLAATEHRTTRIDPAKPTSPPAWPRSASEAGCRTLDGKLAHGGRVADRAHPRSGAPSGGNCRRAIVDGPPQPVQSLELYPGRVRRHVRRHPPPSTGTWAGPSMPRPDAGTTAETGGGKTDPGAGGHLALLGWRRKPGPFTAGIAV